MIEQTQRYRSFAFRFSGIQQSDYHTPGLDLRYNRENSPLMLTFSGYNLLNNTNIDSASLRAFTLSRRTDYTFPRTVLVGLGDQF